MKSNQKGFSVVEILIVIVVIGLIAAGWYAWQSNNNTNKSVTTNASQSTQTKQETATKDVDTTVHDVNISLKSEADLVKLPDYTPATFKTYFAEKLHNNKSFNNGTAIVSDTWSINKISQVNIQGGVVPIDKDGVSYEGGAPVIWVVTPAKTWDEESLSGPTCTSKNGGKIYEEFVTTCYDDAHPYGIDNPNGSIKALVQ